MWKPQKPVVIAGRKEMWLNEFAHGYLDLCNDEVDGEWLRGLALTPYPLNSHRAPREAAKVAYVTRYYEMRGD